MILIPHIILGAAIGAKIQNFWLIAILGIVSHFILDKIPHYDYKISKNNKIKSFSKIIIDGALGLIIVIITFYCNNLFEKKYIIWAFVGIFFTLLPVALWFASEYHKNKILQKYTKFHHNSHYKTQKEGAITFLNIFSQIIIVIVSLLLLFVF